MGRPKQRKDQPDEPVTEAANRYRRTMRVDELLATQRTTRAIALTLVAEFGICERVAYLDIAAAYAQLHEDDKSERGVRKDRIRLTWQRQYRRCLQRGELQAANYALDRLTKLDGLYEPDVVEVKNTLDVHVIARVLTPLQREQRIAELKGRLPQPVLDVATDDDAD